MYRIGNRKGLLGYTYCLERGCKMLVVRLLREAGKRGWWCRLPGGSVGSGCWENLLGEAAGIPLFGEDVGRGY